MCSYSHKRIIICLILLLSLNTSQAYSKPGVLGKVKTAADKVLKFVTHPRVVAVLDYAASIMHVYYDASTDAVFWQISANRNKGYTIEQINELMHGGSNFYNVHFYKNMSRLALVIKGYCVGISFIHVKNGDIHWKRLLRRELGMIPMMSTFWQLRYKYCRYGIVWDTSAEHNKTRYVIPLPTKDIKIALEGWQVTTANLAELGVSGYFFVTDVFTELKPQLGEIKNKIKKANISYENSFSPELLLNVQGRSSLHDKEMFSFQTGKGKCLQWYSRAKPLISSNIIFDKKLAN